MINSRAAQTTFTTCLANLQAISVWWSEGEGRIVVRSLPFDHSRILLASRGIQPAPPDVIFVGSYAHPFPSRDFLSDLRDAIRRHAQKSLAA